MFSIAFDLVLTNVVFTSVFGTFFRLLSIVLSSLRYIKWCQRCKGFKLIRFLHLSPYGNVRISFHNFMFISPIYITISMK